jgi:ABC-type uncharacterized transport system permease subunit
MQHDEELEGLYVILFITLQSCLRPCLDFDISFLFTSFSFHFHGVSNLDFFVNFDFGKN